MKLFTHYKNKPYKYIGQAKHSETLQDMVIYETRYENSLAKIWVRPKEMFFESVMIEGANIPRFKETQLTIKETSEIKDLEIQFIATVMEKAFGQWDPKWFFSTFNNHQKYFLLMASIENTPVAFKLGYEMSEIQFYSWLGGVIPEYRGLGIASDLMKLQHDWCKKKGYGKIQTKTQNRFRHMLLLNIRFGFDVVGFHASDEGGPKIVLEKKI